MNADSTPQVVDFITVEETDDLIVSFVLPDKEPGHVVSLILHRCPKVEPVLPEDERGVNVSHESFPRELGDPDLLQRIRVEPPHVSITTKYTQYELDVSKADPSELESAQRVLKRMNFDNRFVLGFA